MSRRGNGLTAEAYVPLADLAPQLADAMLAALRDAGIAAYAAPAPGKTGGYLDVQLPEEPTDRLYADAEFRQAAEEILQSRLPELRADYAAARDEDEIFAEIVAGSTARRRAARCRGRRKRTSTTWTTTSPTAPSSGPTTRAANAPPPGS